MKMEFKVVMSFDQENVIDKNLKLMKERLMKLVKAIIESNNIDEHITIEELK